MNGAMATSVSVSAVFAIHKQEEERHTAVAGKPADCEFEHLPPKQSEDAPCALEMAGNAAQLYASCLLDDCRAECLESQGDDGGDGEV